MKRFLAVLLALACAHPAWAQQAPTFDPASAAREALERADAEEFFEVVQDSTFAEVRHRGSGLHCAWGPNDTVEITVFPSTPGVARGDDVGCAHATPFGAHTLYATRHPSNINAKTALASAVWALRARFAKAKAVRIAQPKGVAALLNARMPKSESAQFLVNGEMTRISVAQVDGWTIKSRYTGPVGMDSRADVVWMSALRNPLKSRGLPPYDKGPLASAPD